jgi:riboflavin kinase/FMN adenylyltransferase
MQNQVKFQSRKVTGDGRGKLLGFPTINLIIPDQFNLEYGIYAVWIWLDAEKYPGALHYGPVPTFDKVTVTLEVFVLTEAELLNERVVAAAITIETVKKLRDVKKFDTAEALIVQMTADVAAARQLLTQ